MAAPTAGLHFDELLLEQIRARGVEMAFVTLHVGAGTFQPVRVDKIEDHHMHSEYAEVPQEVVDAIAATRARGGRVVAVGTTSVRSLESAAKATLAQAKPLAPFFNDTDIFIFPGYEFQVVDAMITNFHLPESTLIMLVSAFAGYDNVMAAYRPAVAGRSTVSSATGTPCSSPVAGCRLKPCPSEVVQALLVGMPAGLYYRAPRPFCCRTVSLTE